LKVRRHLQGSIIARTKTKPNDTAATLGFEAKLCAAADALRNLKRPIGVA